jgi:hypothetical protein
MEGEPNHPLTPGFPFTPMELSKDIETVLLVALRVNALANDLSADRRRLKLITSTES